MGRDGVMFGINLLKFQVFFIAKPHRESRQFRVLGFVFGLSGLPCQAELSPQAIALNCMSCHEGVSTSASLVLPDLSTLSKQDIRLALLAYKYDKKPATLMPRIAKGFSDNELIAVAEFIGK